MNTIILDGSVWNLPDVLHKILTEIEQGIGASNMLELSRLNKTDAREVILDLSTLEVEDLSASGFQKQVNSLTSLVQTCKSREGLQIIISPC